jgi:hypothetical protein
MTAVLPSENRTAGHLRAGSPASLQVLDPLTYPGWDSLLATHPDASIFHGVGWARTLAEAYAFRCRYVVAITRGRLTGLLPIIEARSWLRGTRGISLSFTDECPPLVSPDMDAETLLAFAVREGEARNWKHLELRAADAFGNSLPRSVSFYGHRLCLDASIGEIFARFDSSVKRAIRKAERSGVTVQFGTGLDAIESYYSLHCRTRTRHGAPPQPFSFFHSLWDNVLQRNQGFVALAFHEQRPIAGAVFLQFGTRAVYKFAASDERRQELRGANLVIRQAIDKFIQDGVTELTFGKTSLSNDGLRRFKQHWGANEYQICYSRYSFERQEFVQTPDVASGAHARVLAHLPMFLSRLVGRALYPHMS